jgi:thioredoxin 2
LIDAPENDGTTAMTDNLLIPCPHCNALNRLPQDRLAQSPLCGRCKEQVLPGAPFDVNEGGFASQLKGDLPLLLDVWADWCGPCKAFAPTFKQAAGQLNGRCRLAKLDSEANRNLSAQLGIRSIPSLILFRQGREVARQSGALPLPQLLGWLREQGVA